MEDGIALAPSAATIRQTLDMSRVPPLPPMSLRDVGRGEKPCSLQVASKRSIVSAVTISFLVASGAFLYSHKDSFAATNFAKAVKGRMARIQLVLQKETGSVKPALPRVEAQPQPLPHIVSNKDNARIVQGTADMRFKPR